MGRAGVVLAIGVLAACSPTLDWREIRSTEGGFVVSLPGKPQVVTREIELPLVAGADKVTMTMTSAGVGGTLFAVGVAQLPANATRDAASLRSCVAYFRDGLLRNVGAGAADTEKEAPWRNRGTRSAPKAARAFEARGVIAIGGRHPEPARLAARIYVVDDRVYQIVAMGRPDDLPDNEIETFFTSFRLSRP